MSIPSTRPVNDSAKLGGIGASSTLQYRGVPPLDLNKATTVGAYLLSGNNTFVNGPPGTNFGDLLVFGDTSRLAQLFVDLEGKAYTRIYSNEKWSVWRDMYTMPETDSANIVFASNLKGIVWNARKMGNIISADIAITSDADAIPGNGGVICQIRDTAYQPKKTIHVPAVGITSGGTAKPFRVDIQQNGQFFSYNSDGTTAPCRWLVINTVVYTV